MAHIISYSLFIQFKYLEEQYYSFLIISLFLANFKSRYFFVTQNNVLIAAILEHNFSFILLININLLNKKLDEWMSCDLAL